jgi:hypothetical protein
LFRDGRWEGVLYDNSGARDLAKIRWYCRLPQIEGRVLLSGLGLPQIPPSCWSNQSFFLVIITPGSVKQASCLLCPVLSYTVHRLLAKLRRATASFDLIFLSYYLICYCFSVVAAHHGMNPLSDRVDGWLHHVAPHLPRVCKNDMRNYCTMPHAYVLYQVQYRYSTCTKYDTHIHYVFHHTLIIPK